MNLQTVKRVHLNFGLITVIIFLGSGYYMRLHFPALYAANETMRFIFRANHIYILLAGVINILLGLYAGFYAVPWRRNVQIAGSILLLLAPALLICAFFLEPVQMSPERPLTSYGIFSAFGGTILHLTANIPIPKKGR